MIKLKALRNYLRREFYDERVTEHWPVALLQSVITSVVVFIILLSLSEVSSNVVAASLASTAFFVFALPHSPYARAKCVIGGYIIGTITGVLCAYLMLKLSHMLVPSEFSVAFFGALCMLLSFLLMVITGLEHPPACSFALALILRTPSLWVVGVTIASLSLITVTRYILMSRLKNII